MPTALPVIRGASAALYPFTQTISFDTGLIQFHNGAEQRWVKRLPLVKFSLPYGKLSTAQKATLLGAFNSAKGGFDTTLMLTLGSQIYTDLSFDSDEWVATENDTNLYDGPVTLSSTLTHPLGVFTAGTNFPVLTNSAIGQRPYSERIRYQTVAVQMEAGPKYAYAEFAGGLAGYPGSGLRAWDFDERHLTDEDLDIRRNHFLANFGRAYTFTFTDRAGTPFTSVRYVSDIMTITYNGFNDSSVKTSLVQSF